MGALCKSNLQVQVYFGSKLDRNLREPSSRLGD